MYDWQWRFINEILIPQYYVHGVVKGRQIGFSSLMVDLMVHNSLTKSSHVSMMIVIQRVVAHNLLSWCLDRITCLETKTGMDLIASQTNNGVTLVNGSKITFKTCHTDAGKGEHVHLLIFDEAAFMPHFNDVWLAMFPTVGPDGKIILGSTPHGKNDFYKHIERLRTSNVFLVHEIPSSAVHSPAWINQDSHLFTPDHLAAEHECKFI